MTANRSERFRPITERNVTAASFWPRLSADVREGVEVVSRVLPFRTNDFVTELIDWEEAPHDPIFQLTFPQRGMLADDDYRRVRALLEAGDEPGLAAAVTDVRRRLNPHPAGQLTHNVPRLDGEPLAGVQHKYAETVLFFPAAGQSCHAYCTYCFRWAQFVDLPEPRIEARSVDRLVEYLRRHHEVSDVLFTGGDPLVMKTRILRRYVEPLLADDLEHVRNVRLGTKALSYWPQRFLGDDDADDLLRLVELIVERGRTAVVMAHFSHPRELEPPLVQRAIARLRSAGAQLRMQAPVVRHVNDSAEAWRLMWQRGVALGVQPYYMFVERDTGPRHYFELPLVRTYEIFRDAFSRVSGLARTVRGPSMSAHPGKVRILGVGDIGGERAILLDFIQARNPEHVGRPFAARFDPDATWIDQLRPLGDEPRFFFEAASEPLVTAAGGPGQ